MTKPYKKVVFAAVMLGLFGIEAILNWHMALYLLVLISGALGIWQLVEWVKR